MPEIAFMKVDGISGESNYKGHKDEIDVLQFRHTVTKEVDPLDCSKVRSDRRHGVVEVVKVFDKASPLLAQKLCEGGTIGEIKIKWYRQPAGGGSDPEHYYSHTFKDCIITEVEPHMASALEVDKRAQGHLERLRFGYKQVTWTSETGGTEFTDAVRE